MKWTEREGNEVRNMTDVVSDYFRNISEKFFPAEHIDNAVSYLNNNASLAAKDHIIYGTLKNTFGVKTSFNNPVYSKKKYNDGLAAVFSNLHEHLGLEHPKLDDITKILKPAISEEISKLAEIKNRPSKLIANVVSNYFEKISKNFFPAEKMDKAVEYLNNNANIAAKEYITISGMKKNFGIENDFYNSPYSEQMYVDGLAGVFSNLHEHLEMPRPPIKELAEKLETIVSKEIPGLSRVRN